ncbi:MAG: hypothetical protein ACRDTU_11765 [Micromonosporaceae bacterium]
MDNDGPADWPPDGYSDGGDADLGGPDDGALSDNELGYDPGDPGDSDSPTDGYDVAPDGTDGPDGPDDSTGLGDAELSDDSGLHDAPVADDTYAPDATVGTDPDTNPLADNEAWGGDPFPEALDLEEPPEPVDGMPWSDPALLGDAADGDGSLGDPAGTDAGAPPVSDLYAYDRGQPPADGTDAWGSLADSEDPATSSLARFWAPGG